MTTHDAITSSITHLSYKRKFSQDSTKIANIIDGDEFYTQVSDAAREIASRLYFHCGPYATNAVIPSPLGGINTVIDQYTKDGISIVDQWKSNSVVTDYLKRLVVFIGRRVDMSCHDGTTTSMMLFTLIISNLFTVLKDHEDLRVDLPTLSRYMEETLLCLANAIERNSYTSNHLADLLRISDPNVTDLQIKRSIAYYQSLIASKGDRELALIIAEVFSTMPVEIYGQYIIKTHQFEVKERYTADHQDYLIELFANMLISSQNNSKLGTEFLLESCDFMMTSVPIIAGNPHADAIMALIDPDDEFRDLYGLEKGVRSITQPLVILMPELGHSQISQAIYLHNKEYPDATIYPICYNVSVLTRQMHSVGLCATAGRPDLTGAIALGDITQCIIPNVKVHHRKSTLYLSNFYEKTDSAYHPFYDNPTLNETYTKTLTALREIIENVTRKHISTLLDTDLNAAITLYRSMCCQRIIDVKLGGTTHDMIASRTIVEDAIGSAVSALSDGVVFGGHLIMLNTMNQIHHSHSPINDAVNGSISHALMTVLDSIYRVPHGHKTPNSYLQHLFPADLSSQIPFYIADGYGKTMECDLIAMIDDFIACKDITILLQPTSGYLEQLRRMADLIPKFVNCSCLIDTSYSPKREGA